MIAPLVHLVLVYLLRSVRSSTELERERPDLLDPLFDSRPTRPSEDEGAKIEVTKQSNPI